MFGPNKCLRQKVAEGVTFLVPGVVEAMILASLELSLAEEHVVDGEG